MSLSGFLSDGHSVISQFKLDAVSPGGVKPETFILDPRKMQSQSGTRRADKRAADCGQEARAAFGCRCFGSRTELGL